MYLEKRKEMPPNWWGVKKPVTKMKMNCKGKEDCFMKKMAFALILTGLVSFGTADITSAAPIQTSYTVGSDMEVQELSAWPRIRDSLLGRHTPPPPPPHRVGPHHFGHNHGGPHHGIHRPGPGPHRPPMHHPGQHMHRMSTSVTVDSEAISQLPTV